MTVSLILPCYNPPPGWEKTVYNSFRLFSGKVSGETELVVVLDGENVAITHDSLDYLRNNLEEVNIIQYKENKGKGYAIRQGVKVAKGDIIVYTDVDFPYTIESMLEIHETLAHNNADVAVGVKDEAYYAHVPFVRRLISRYLRVLIRVFLSMPITDTQCGLKGFQKQVSPLFLNTTVNRYLFDLEFIRNCFTTSKFRVKAIPVSLNENVHFRSMNYRILFSESVSFVKLLFSKKR